MFVDFVSGAKSAKEAFGDFADAIYARALQFLADKAIQALFDSFGNKGASSGGSGGGWANILSSIFGGQRAGGGATNAGKVYRVNENGPEMLSVSGKDYLMMGSQGGMVTPNHAIAGGSSQVNNFNFVGRVDRRTQDQVEAKLAQRSRRAMARNS